MELEGIRAYKIIELSKKEKLNYRTIKKRTDDYIPILFESWQARANCKIWNQSKPYSIRYIRIKDLEKYLK